jgi:Kdo2-lipid IVA lauroyltransferase/acyltransferase
MIRGNRKPLTAGMRLRHSFETFGLGLVAIVIPLFPRRLVQLGAAGLGWLAYYLSPSLRRISRQNLDVAFGDSRSPSAKRRIARTSLQHFAATIAGLFWAPRLTAENFRRYIEIDEVSMTRLRGQGVIFATMHYGDWEMLGLAAGFFGFPMTIVQENMRNKALEEIFARLRSRSGHHLVTQELAVTRLFRALRKGDSTALLIDTNTNRRGGGIWLEFFGLPVFSSPAFALLALRTGAPVVVTYAKPLPGGRSQLVFGQPSSFKPTGDEENDIRALSQHCLKLCEDVIRAEPEPWLWVYKRWTPRPTEERSRYPEYSRPIGKRQFHKHRK